MITTTQPVRLIGYSLKRSFHFIYFIYLVLDDKHIV